ncbi:hypothetical protein JCM3766R1_001432 [Sporobolomyces carnicolor]
MADSLPTPRDSPAVEPSKTSSSTTTTTTTTTAVVAEDHLARGIRFLALSKYAEASESLSYAVETLVEKNGELSIENVDALILYGKALLANAIEQSAVLGGTAVPTTTAADAPSSSTAPAEAGPSSSKSAAFHFGGDGDEDDDDHDGQSDQDKQGQGEGEGEGEGDDDFEAAFQMLDMARRTIELEVERLERQLGEFNTSSSQTSAGSSEERDDERRARERERVERKEKLAEVHRLLGDVATESEQFESAVEEYSSSLSILTELRQPSDRQLSEQHMLIALALEFLPNQISRAVSHAEKAKSVLALRLAELERDDNDDDKKHEKEIVDLKELIRDVDMKIEDLKTVPTAPAPSAADFALEQFLRQATGISSSSAGAVPVNDLNSLVKKKKKKPTTAVVDGDEGEGEGEGEGKGKRKADPDTHDGPDEDAKKVKL